MKTFLRVLIGSAKSKTVWVAAAIALFTAFDQDLQNWIATHTSGAGKTVAALMIFLRLLTVGSVSEKGVKKEKAK